MILKIFGAVSPGANKSKMERFWPSWDLQDPDWTPFEVKDAVSQLLGAVSVAASGNIILGYDCCGPNGPLGRAQEPIGSWGQYLPFPFLGCPFTAVSAVEWAQALILPDLTLWLLYL